MNGEWSESEGKLEKTYTFGDFSAALAFVNKVGEVAERLGHHPDIHLEQYKQVRISTTTHDEGNRITDRDRALAAAIDSLTI